MTTKILVIDDHPVIQDALRLLMSNFVDISEVSIASSAEEGLQIGKASPSLQLISIDIGLPGASGAEAIRLFSRTFSNIPIVVISGSDSRRDVEAALRAGAKAFISKTASADTVHEAIKEILSGKLPDNPWIGNPGVNISLNSHSRDLTPQQQRILGLLCKGHRNKDIAALLDISEVTVKLHLSSIFRALQVTNRTEAVLAARHLGIALE